MSGLTVLVVDDEEPNLAELSWLLSRDARIASVLTAASGTAALEILRGAAVDAVFLDIAMPGLSGLDLAAVLGRFKEPPAIVFVTAHSEHAIEAFDLHAVDYLLKPVREERLREAVRRLADAAPAALGPAEDVIAVELGGVTRLVSRADVTWVEAQGDYSRLHTGPDAQDSHLVRLPISQLEERWREAGFLRIHRSVLVPLGRIDEVREADGRLSVVVGGRELPVSRRHTAALREQLRRTRQTPS
ncbi:LytR/AlgR family response regulator transcription factor [Nocardioides sp. Kera G14]|uniref:LytR/AlgR family response regulator transcription factor n=1 Tax=Nocardioides sp. Kera G14 TaxID=2884264 RepID=UPI001D0F9434|nr:LytTR family DNA-binding domain-containing protein [Nocardioides sp. Kera G14]UDY23786.1 LytTR family DNA-binding domain-containing protein [Nocardioides sp. Kera G14]